MKLLVHEARDYDDTSRKATGRDYSSYEGGFAGLVWCLDHRSLATYVELRVTTNVLWLFSSHIMYVVRYFIDVERRLPGGVGDQYRIYNGYQVTGRTLTRSSNELHRARDPLHRTTRGYDA